VVSQNRQPTRNAPEQVTTREQPERTRTTQALKPLKNPKAPRQTNPRTSPDFLFSLFHFRFISSCDTISGFWANGSNQGEWITFPVLIANRGSNGCW
jgi:hypothetical protein